MLKHTLSNTLHSCQTVAGNILTPEGWIGGTLFFDTHIRDITGIATDPADHEGHYIVPGFIDLHVHGGGGKDVMQSATLGVAALETIANQQIKHGTTTWLATTVTAPMEELETVLGVIQQAMDTPHWTGATLLGVHLEGPYLNPDKLGAQPAATQVFNIKQLQDLCALSAIKLITLSPEMLSNIKVITSIVELGIKVQLGHTLGTYEQGVAALAAGAEGFTHLFNAMSPLHHRAPGMVGAALAHARYAEIIPDLLHVHPGAIQAALRSIPYLYCVTDSTAAAGMPDGSYQLGNQTVHKCLGGVRLEDGTLAGSALTMDQALRNLVQLGLSIEEAIKRVSTFPADYLGLEKKGRLAMMCCADFVILDHDLTVQAVYVEGRRYGLGGNPPTK